MVKELIFEGQERLMTIENGILIQAFKIKPEQIFSNALPLRAIGYPGINTVEIKLMIPDAEALIDHILEMLNPDEKALLLRKLKDQSETE
jgi:hypothetical protein